MNSYIDQYGRYHDKPLKFYGDIPSNNGWIYTAYARALGLPVARKKLASCLNACNRGAVPLIVDRTPNKFRPPMSRDEIIGMISLQLLDPKFLKKSNYNFCNLSRAAWIRRPSFGEKVEAFKILWKIRKEHRNFAWLNNLVKTYPILFKLSFSDRFYVTAPADDDSVTFSTFSFLLIAFHLSVAHTLLFGSTSAKLIIWLQLKDMHHPLAKLLPIKKWFGQYFPKEHPFNLKLAEN